MVEINNEEKECMVAKGQEISKNGVQFVRTSDEDVIDVDSSPTEKIIEEEKDGTTIYEAFWSISNTIQGLPILAVPYTFKFGGWWTLFTLLIVSVTSLYSCKVLVKCLYEERDGTRVRVRSSYMEIGEAFWKSGGKWMVTVFMVIELVFVSTLYPDLVGLLFKKSLPDISLPVWAWTIIGGCALLPNALLKSLSQVAWSSIITVVGALVIFFSVLTFCFTKVNDWDIQNMNEFDGLDFPASLGILLSCYLAQPFVPFIESNMKTPERFGAAIGYSFVIMTSVNALFSLICTLSFFPQVETAITNNLPLGLFRQSINSTALILVYTSYSLPIFTCFNVLENCTPFVPVGFTDDIYRPPVQTLRVGLIAVTVLMAAFIPGFHHLLTFVGSITGICLQFIFPPVFHLDIYHPDLTWWEMVLDVLVLGFGISCMTICLVVPWLSSYACFQSVFVSCL